MIYSLARLSSGLRDCPLVLRRATNEEAQQRPAKVLELGEATGRGVRGGRRRRGHVCLRLVVWASQQNIGERKLNHCSTNHSFFIIKKLGGTVNILNQCIFTRFVISRVNFLRFITVGAEEARYMDPWQFTLPLGSLLLPWHCADQSCQLCQGDSAARHSGHNNPVHWTCWTLQLIPFSVRANPTPYPFFQVPNDYVVAFPHSSVCVELFFYLLYCVGILGDVWTNIQDMWEGPRKTSDGGQSCQII